MTPQIVLCPPARAHGFANFDTNQFEKRIFPVKGAHFGADGEAISNRISFDDSAKMYVSSRGGRRRNDPEWGCNHKELQRLILETWLRRLYCFPRGRQHFLAEHTDLQPLQLLAEIQKQLVAKCESKLLPELDELCLDYVTEPNEERRARLQLRIAGLDSEIRWTLRGPQGLAQLFHLTWGLRYGCVETAEALKITATSVRQQICRAKRVHAEISGETYTPMCSWGGRKRAEQQPKPPLRRALHPFGR